MRKFFYWTGNVVRDTGVTLEKAGMRMQGHLAYKEQLCLHRRLMPLFDIKPFIGQASWVAPTAALIGDVIVGARSTVWYGAVLRGDGNKIRIGDHCVIGDRVVIHIASGNDILHQPARATTIGSRVYVGPGALLHGCTIGDGVKVESGAVVMDGAEIGKNAVIASGSLVTPEKKNWCRRVMGRKPSKIHEGFDTRRNTSDRSFN